MILFKSVHNIYKACIAHAVSILSSDAFRSVSCGTSQVRANVLLTNINLLTNILPVPLNFYCMSFLS